jgi:hypothetical protein
MAAWSSLDPLVGCIPHSEVGLPVKVLEAPVARTVQVVMSGREFHTTGDVKEVLR